MDGVTYHLSSSFAKKAEMGEVIDRAELEKLVVSAYEDKVKGVMPEALCLQLMNRYEDERRGKLEQRTRLTGQLEATQEDEQATDEWLAVILDQSKILEEKLMRFWKSNRRPLWAVGLALGILFLGVGAAQDQFAVIWKKAVMICMECIGIG